MQETRSRNMPTCNTRCVGPESVGIRNQIVRKCRCNSALQRRLIQCLELEVHIFSAEVGPQGTIICGKARQEATISSQFCFKRMSSFHMESISLSIGSFFRYHCYVAQQKKAQLSGSLKETPNSMTLEFTHDEKRSAIYRVLFLHRLSHSRNKDCFRTIFIISL